MFPELSQFKSPISHHDGNRFVIHWTDWTLEADAYVLFETDKMGQVTRISMTRLDDGHFDFENLKLKGLE